MCITPRAKKTARSHCNFTANLHKFTQENPNLTRSSIISVWTTAQHLVGFWSRCVCELPASCGGNTEHFPLLHKAVHHRSTILILKWPQSVLTAMPWVVVGHINSRSYLSGCHCASPGDTTILVQSKRRQSNHREEEGGVQMKAQSLKANPAYCTVPWHF